TSRHSTAPSTTAASASSVGPRRVPRREAFTASTPTSSRASGSGSRRTAVQDEDDSAASQTGRLRGTTPVEMEATREMDARVTRAWAGREVAREGEPAASLTDDALMARVRGGDGEALAVLFDRHKTRLFGYLYRMVGERCAAEDLLG